MTERKPCTKETTKGQPCALSYGHGGSCRAGRNSGFSLMPKTKLSDGNPHVDNVTRLMR